jgi:hypothetical protein
MASLKSILYKNGYTEGLFAEIDTVEGNFQSNLFAFTLEKIQLTLAVIREDEILS